MYHNISVQRISANILQNEKVFNLKGYWNFVYALLFLYVKNVS